MTSAEPLLLALPGPGRWRARNSPAVRVPSHGTTRFALDRSIDLVPVDEQGRTAAFRLRSVLRSEPPEVFAGFGRELLSPVHGVVESVHDGEQDHPAHRGLPSIGYALTQGRRVRAGWRAVAGNHVILRCRRRGELVYVALCHLQRWSIVVRPGQALVVGERIGRCGNSGNSTEPHLHLQAMSRPDPRVARPMTFTLPGGLPRDGEIRERPEG